MLQAKDWEIAHKMALDLVEKQTDVNELSKSLAYLRAYQNQEEAGKNFFNYLQTLTKNGNKVGHSQKTITYYQNIKKVCEQYLNNYQNEPYLMLQILGWVARLMRYYKDNADITTPEVTTNTVSEKQLEIAAVAQSQKFKVGQVIDAKVTAIKGNNVTFTILNAIKLSNKEPKKYQSFQEGQAVKVEITELKEDGSIKKIKSV